MPCFDIVKEYMPKETFRVNAIKNQFTITEEKIKEKFSGNIEYSDDWNIGVIVGNSGTGKTTIAKQLFSDKIINKEYTNNSVIDDMPENKSISEITQAFNSVGFSSPPSWLKPYSVLSNGEKMRVELANAILTDNDIIIFDEFTSVIDRNIAKIGSMACQKSIRKSNKKFIAVTCHYDIIEWLQPDWVFNTNDMTFKNTRGLLQRPDIKLEIRKSDRTIWRYFSKYHYLNSELHKGSMMFAACINNIFVGCCAVLHFPHPSASNIKHVHRVVVLPDYQGIGIGGMLLNVIGDYYLAGGYRFMIVTSTPALMQGFKNSKNWHLVRHGRVNGISSSGNRYLNNTVSKNRITASWEYKHG